MDTEFLIIGGGVAGLAAFNHLRDFKKDVILIEERSFPSHKICGEFLSPEAIPLLKKWDIVPGATISSLRMISDKTEFRIDLPQHAAALSRYFLDDSLAKRAVRLGGCLKTGCKVVKIDVPKKSGESYRLQLSSDETLSAKRVLISTGRLPGLNGRCNPRPFRYVGAKAHFEGIDLKGELRMLLLKGAYFGMAGVGAGVVNVAGLIACTEEEAKQPFETFHIFLNSDRGALLKKALDQGRLSFSDWMAAPVPEFGVRENPSLPNAYFLGDAKGVIPPAAGGGISMALASGVLAGEMALGGMCKEYDREWRFRYERRIGLGKALHRLFLNQTALRLLFPLVRQFPWIARSIFNMTRS